VTNGDFLTGAGWLICAGLDVDFVLMIVLEKSKKLIPSATRSRIVAIIRNFILLPP
jgi:hypothetical protein